MCRPAVCVLLLFLSGCLSQHPVGKDPLEVGAPITEADFVVHEVRSKRETLPQLAKRYTGDSKNASLLQQATPGTANKLTVGQIILIPKDLLKDPERIAQEKIMIQSASVL